jgi:integrase
MTGVYIQKNSLFYYLRYYDKLEEDKTKRRKSINTKIYVTPGDLERNEVAKKKGVKPVLRGTKELKTLIDTLRRQLSDKYIEKQTQLKIKPQPLLSIAYKQFVAERTILGMDNELRAKTILSYNKAVDHFIRACDDREPHRYTKDDFYTFLKYLDTVTIKNPSFRGEKIRQEANNPKKITLTTKSIYVRTLKALWNYFLNQNIVIKQIFGNIRVNTPDPEPIPSDEIRIILQYLQTLNVNAYNLILFLFLTGCRVSSAMVQLRQDIDLSSKIIKIQNVKTGARKGKGYYQFPIYKELYELLEEMLKKTQEGRLFSNYKINEYDYTTPLSFWDRAIKVLLKKGDIKKRYTLKQIRSAAASYFINELKLDIFQVKKMLDHSSITVTENYYIQYDINNIRITLDKIKIL